MAEITFEESGRQIRALTDLAEQAMADGRPDDAAERWRAVLAHPCAHHQLAAYEILDEVHRAYREAGLYEEAIAAGYRSVPDPETDIAECYLDAGELGKADALFATLRERDPEDVWLYSAAAYSYLGIDVTTSLRWALDGIEVALATGDPDQVVMQLLELAEDAWGEMAEPIDQQLVDRVERFCDEWTPVTSPRRSGGLPPRDDRPCVHCGYQPETSRAVMDEPARRNRRRLLEVEDPEALGGLDAAFGPEPKAKPSGPIALATGWFPAEQWAEACQRWPELLDDRPAEHRAYTQATEAQIKRIARHAVANRLHVAAMTVDGLEAHAEESGNDPGSGAARSHYAATLLRTGDAVAWPPGRNEPCWCGSVRKYKKCCGPVPAAPDDPS